MAAEERLVRPFRRGLARLGLELREGEGRLVALLFTGHFLLVTFQYATKSVRQSSFINDLGAIRLPWVYVAVAVCSYPAMRLLGRLAARTSAHRLMTATAVAVAASMGVFWLLYAFSWRWVSALLYVWLSIAYAVAISLFWSLSSQLLDARQAKRLFGLVGAGGLLGGVAGGQVARLISELSSTRATFLGAGGILLLAEGVLATTARAGPDSPRELSSPASEDELRERGAGALQGSRHLQLIAAILAIAVMVAQVVDLQFNWAVENATTGLDQRTAFYGNFFSFIGLAAFVFQVVFTSRIHRFLGVGTALRVLPATLGAGSAALLACAAFAPGLLLPAAVALKVGDGGLRHSLDQSTRELLFLPVPPRRRVRAKGFIDVFVQRGARGLGALLLLPVTYGLLTPVGASWISVVLVVVWLALTNSAHREYVRTFRRGLKRRIVDTELAIDLRDATSLELLIESLGSPDPRQVLQSIRLLEAHGRGRLVPPLLLYHDHPEVRQATLRVLAESDRTEAAPLVERRLGDPDPEVRAAALRTLSRLQHGAVTDLMLPRLEEAEPAVRAAAVAALSVEEDAKARERAEAVLQDLLRDERAEVRVEAAKAVGAIPEPRHSEALHRLLYDEDPQVVREAIAAVGRRVARDGYRPEYVPRLVSLLENRRVRHEARESLVAFGEPAVPILAYFGKDPQEPMWIRRALPTVLARIGTPAAAAELVDLLQSSKDHFHRRKVVAALASLPPEVREGLAAESLILEVRSETRRYLQALVDLHALGLNDRGSLQGVAVEWRSGAEPPAAIERLLADRMSDHLQNLFGLLAVLHPRSELWAAHRSLTSSSQRLRSHAIEYLDNTLSGEVRRSALAVIDDSDLESKQRLAERAFGVVAGDPSRIVRRRLLESVDHEPDEPVFAILALCAVAERRLTGLYPEVERLASGAEGGVVQESAAWVVAKLDRAGGGHPA